MCYHALRYLRESSNTQTTKQKEIKMSEIFVNARAVLISLTVVAASVAVPVLTMIGAA